MLQRLLTGFGKQSRGLNPGRWWLVSVLLKIVTKTALRVILAGSALLFSGACFLASGQAASTPPTATGPLKESPKGTPARAGLHQQTSPSKDVAASETLYADLADSYSVISTIDSGLFATYRGKDRAAWVHLYSENRRQLAEKLSTISASGLSPLDARALDVMKRHLHDDLPEQFNGQNAPSEHCQDARRQDLSLAALEGALDSCFVELGNALEFEGKRITRVSALGMLEEINEEERRKKLFYAFEPLWNAVDGKHDAASPYRRLLPLVVAAAEGHGTEGRGTWVDSAAKTIGVSSPEVERWLEQILDTWRQVDGGQMVEPWNYFYRGGEAARLLSTATRKIPLSP